MTAKNNNIQNVLNANREYILENEPFYKQKEIEVDSFFVDYLYFQTNVINLNTELKTLYSKYKKNLFFRKRFNRKFLEYKEEILNQYIILFNNFSDKKILNIHDLYFTEIVQREDKYLAILLDEIVYKITTIERLLPNIKFENDVSTFIFLQEELFNGVLKDVIAHLAFNEIFKQNIRIKLEYEVIEYENDLDCEKAKNSKMESIIISLYDLTKEYNLDLYSEIIDDFNDNILEIYSKFNNLDIKFLTNNYLKYIELELSLLEADDFNSVIEYMTNISIDTIENLNNFIDNNTNLLENLFLLDMKLIGVENHLDLKMFGELISIDCINQDICIEGSELEKNIDSNYTKTNILKFFSKVSTKLQNKVNYMYQENWIIESEFENPRCITNDDSNCTIIVPKAQTTTEIVTVVHEITHALVNTLSLSENHFYDLTLDEVHANIFEYLFLNHYILELLKSSSYLNLAIYLLRRKIGLLIELLYHPKIYGKFELDVWKNVYDFNNIENKLVSEVNIKEGYLENIYLENLQKVYNFDFEGDLEDIKIRWTLENNIISQPFYLYNYSLSAYVSSYILMKIETESDFLDKYLETTFSKNYKNNLEEFLNELGISLNEILKSDEIMNFFNNKLLELEKNIINKDELEFEIYDLEKRGNTTIKYNF